MLPRPSALTLPRASFLLPVHPLLRCCRLRPDGFGGYIERTEDVQPVFKQLTSNLFEDDSPPPAPKAAPPPPAAKKSAAAKSSAPSLSFDDMLANSVASKESVIGRSLTPEEVADMREKLRSLMN